MLRTGVPVSRFYSTISIPNILTLIRILLTPLFVILLLRDLFFTALLVFIIAGITDGLDGLIARWLNQRTALGAYLDPMADKLLLVSAYICLPVMNAIPEWLAVIVISRDVIILLGIAIFTLTQKKYEVRPTFVSKCTTTLQIVTVVIVLLDPNRFGVEFVLPVAYWTTATLTILSGLHYIYFGMRILQENNNQGDIGNPT
jgi:cardiolipin synthase (CMP-forming)